MIKFVKGDTFAFKFKIIDQDGNDVALSDIKTIFITCKKYPKDIVPALFQKTLEDITLEDGYCHAVFEPADTQSLPVGTYYFDREVTLNNGYRKTKLTEFELTPETTAHRGK